MIKENIIQNKSFDFAVDIVNLYKGLIRGHKEYALSKQILRSGTSIGANIEEAIGGYSKKDFAAKMSVSYKEARETHYWLRLLNATEFISDTEYKRLIADCDELLKILYTIVNKSKNN